MTIENKEVRNFDFYMVFNHIEAKAKCPSCQKTVQNLLIQNHFLHSQQVNFIVIGCEYCYAIFSVVPASSFEK